MKNFHGIIFAFYTYPALRDLIDERTASSVPFCSRYRLIDFPLSSMRNAGIRDVGVIMQNDYQSLIDHISNGKAWDMNRKIGGLRLLPPYGLPEYYNRSYTGTIEALNAVRTYVEEIKDEYIVLMPGRTCANIDLAEVTKQHIASGAEITAVVAEKITGTSRHRYIADADGKFAEKMLINQGENDSVGYPSLEVYVISKALLLKMMEICRGENLYSFAKDGLQVMIREGHKINLYVHKGYAAVISSVESYYKANGDMLVAENRHSLFPADRPVRTSAVEYVSTYYGENSKSINSLVADDCIIDGEIENCVIHAGVRVAKGAKLKNCVVMRGTQIGENSKLENVILDKYCVIGKDAELKGSVKLPLLCPKYSSL